MTLEQQVLITLLRTSLDGNLQRMPQGSVNWRKVMALAAEQTVTGQLYDVLEKHWQQLSVPSDVKLAWFSSAQAIVSRNRLVDSVLVDLVKALDGAGIPYLLFKGQGNARFYPRVELRSPGDIDIYIGPDNFEAAKSAWQAAGLVDKWDHEDVKHASFVCRGVSVEPHRQAELLPGHRRNSAWQATIAEALKSDDRSGFVIDGTFIRTLPVELNSVMVFIHMFRHFIGGGIRLRQFVDWVYICDHLPYTRRLREYLWDTGFERPWNEFSLMREVFFGSFDADKRSVAIMEHLMNDAPDKRAADIKSGRGPRKGLGRALDAYKSNLVAFRLYPAYSLRFMFRMMRSHFEKYL